MQGGRREGQGSLFQDRSCTLLLTLHLPPLLDLHTWDINKQTCVLWTWALFAHTPSCLTLLVLWTSQTPSAFLRNSVSQFSHCPAHVDSLTLHFPSYGHHGTLCRLCVHSGHVLPTRLRTPHHFYVLFTLCRGGGMGTTGIDPGGRWRLGGTPWADSWA